MNISLLLKSTAIFFVLVSCVDRIHFNITPPKSGYPLSINGFISDEPGPYTVIVESSFDIDSDEKMLERASVKEMMIIDNLGNTETLTEHMTGEYKTDPNGMRGVVGRIYRLRVELLSGEVFESTPDTLRKAGTLESVYTRFEATASEFGPTKYAFRVLFDGSNDNTPNDLFLWRFTSTFKLITHPEFATGEQCNGRVDCEHCSICNIVPKCSGIRNIGTPKNPVFKRFFPCTCCICWYYIYNQQPLLASSLLSNNGVHVKGMYAGSIPVNDYVFQHKVFAEVQQHSIGMMAYNFYRAVNAQHDAVNSLFQPVSGRIPGNFIQAKGSSTSVVGLFYAAGSDSKVIIIERGDIPDHTYELKPEVPELIIGADCTKFIPYSTTEQPELWVE